MRRDVGFMALGALLAIVAMGAAAIKTEGDIETDGQLVSTIAAGTPPLVVESETLVKGLNADRIDDLDAADLALAADTYSKAEVDALLLEATSRRAFYLTNSVHKGGPDLGVDPLGPLGACDAGFHFASLWEIYDVSNLRYDFARPNALVLADSGDGPPSVDTANPGGLGWVRTGSSGIELLGVPGDLTCSLWTDSITGGGTVASLPDDWSTGVPHWAVGDTACFEPLRVWCVEDD